jgi:hypothetical protein
VGASHGHTYANVDGGSQEWTQHEVIPMQNLKVRRLAFFVL